MLLQLVNVSPTNDDDDEDRVKHSYIIVYSFKIEEKEIEYLRKSQDKEKNSS